MRSQTEIDRDNNTASRALEWIASNPAIFNDGPRIKRNPSTRVMIESIQDGVEGISTRQIATALDMSKSVVGDIIVSLQADDPWSREDSWTSDDNPASAAAELAALQEHHPGGYIDDDRAENELTRPLVTLVEPPFVDSGIRADQSHTIKRPITLATSPYSVAA